jgi:hypothetical protein
MHAACDPVLHLNTIVHHRLVPEVDHILPMCRTCRSKRKPLSTLRDRVHGIMASFVVGRKGVPQEQADAWHSEFRELGKQGKFFFSLNRYVFVADKLATA